MSDDIETLRELGVAVHNDVAQLSQDLHALQTALAARRRSVFAAGGGDAVTDFIAYWGEDAMHTRLAGLLKTSKVLRPVLVKGENPNALREVHDFAAVFDSVHAVAALETARRPDADPLDLPGVRVHTRSG